MRITTRNLVVCAAGFSILAAPWQAAHAQRSERITGWIDNRATTLLRGSRSSRIESLTSEGPVEDSMRVSGMSIRFRPTDEQQAELEWLLEDQQDPLSLRYHQWLTPEEYGDRRAGFSR
jgi:hypothetical protein